MINEQKNEKTPVLVVTSDKWSRDSYVVFDDDTIIGGCIPDEWVSETLTNLEIEASDNGDDFDMTREQVASEMEDDFFSDNSDVDEFWPEYHVLRTGNDYYKYDNDGMCKHIDEDDALELMGKMER